MPPFVPAPHCPPLDRRWLSAALALVLVACAGQPVRPGPEGAPPGERGVAPTGTTRVRLMGANISSGNLQSYDPGHGIRIFQGLKPDVAMIQEFNYGSNSDADIRAFVDTAFGKDFSYYRQTGVQIPNGVISRYPILASGEWDDTQVNNRDFVWARIDLPGPKDLWAVSVHLLTSNSNVRNTEAGNLANYLKANVPAGDFIAIGGDFNSDNRSEPLFSAFSAVVSTAGPYPADKNANEGTSANRGKPYDHVLVNDALRAYQTATVVGASSFGAGLVVDTRVYSPLAEIAPAQGGDSGSPNMQHMAIVKDFLVPSDAPPSASLTVLSPNGGERWTTGGTNAITWSASGVANVKLEYTLDGSTWTLLAASVPATPASYSWTLPATVTSAARVRVTDAANASLTDSSDADFALTAPTPSGGADKVILDEVLANEPGSDANGEFVELVNTGSMAVDLSGWTLSDAASTRHTFASGTSLAPGKALVVFGGAAGIPKGLANAVAASTGQLNLGNSGDTVTLKNAKGGPVDTVTYDASLAGSDGVSMNRDPDLTGTTFSLHPRVGSGASSPGKRASGAAY